MKNLLILTSILLFLNSCGIIRPEEGAKVPVSGKERVEKNMEEGRGFRIAGLGKKGGDFLFSSSNPLWRASMDKLSFAPLSVVDYGGGIIITDWYSDGNIQNEAIKISIRFLTNEVRSDSLDIKIFYKKCNQVIDCKISEQTGSLVTELKKKILSKASVYKKERKDKNFKPYKGKTRAKD